MAVTESELKAINILDAGTNWILPAVESQFQNYIGKGNSENIHFSASKIAELDAMEFKKKAKMLGYTEYLNGSGGILENINWVQVGGALAIGALIGILIKKFIIK